MSNTTEPVLTIRPHDQAVVAQVDCRELDHDATLQLQSELTTALDVAPTLALVLGLLVKVHKSLAQAGRTCVLVGVQPRVVEVMSVTGLTRFLVLRGTTEEALQLI
jgi:hypothetical protein